MVRSLNSSTRILTCPYSYVRSVLSFESIPWLLFSSPYHKKGKDQMPVLGGSPSGFSVTALQAGSCWLVQICVVVTPGTILGDVMGVLSLWPKEQVHLCPCPGLILSHTFSHPVASPVLRDYCSIPSLKFIVLFESAADQWLSSGDSSSSLRLVHTSRWALLLMTVGLILNCLCGFLPTASNR